MTYNKIFLVILTVFFLFIAIPRLYYPDLDHGDEFADADVLNSGRNFQRLGFLATKLLPVLEVQAKTPRNAYTHYPPLTQIFYGFMRSMFRIESLSFYRGIALFFSFLNLIFWYLAVKIISRSSLFAFLAALFYVSNSFFIFGTDALTQLAMGEAVKSAILLLFLYAATRPQSLRARILPWLWGLILIEALITYEYIIYFSLFFILFGWFFKSYRYPSRRELFILLSAPVAGFAAHFIQNAWFFGGFAKAAQDLTQSAVQRIVQSVDLPVPKLTFLVWWKQVILHNISAVFNLNYFILLVAVFITYAAYQQAPAREKEEHKPIIRFFLLLFICGLSWYIVFPSHSLAHVFVYFLVRHLLPAASAGMALLFFILYKRALINRRMRVLKIGLLAIALCFAAGNGVLKSALPIHPGAVLHADDFLSFKACLHRLSSLSEEDEVIGLNYYRWPFIGYYTNRKCRVIFDANSLKQRDSKMADYFIFFPFNRQQSQPLLNELTQHYDVLFQCSSVRFPALFLKLKSPG